MENIENHNIFDLWHEKLLTVDNQTFPFSFSKLKKFAVSPQNFVEYVTGIAKKTDAMRFGNIDHTLILEGETFFFASYVLLDRETDLRSNESKNGRIGKIEFAQISEKAALENKQIVRISEMEKALKIREMLMTDGKCRELLLSEGEVEKAIEYNFFHNNTSYFFRGRIDKCGEGYKLDVKNVANFSQKNIAQYIFREKLHVQAAIYQMSEVGNFDDEYWLLMCDENNVLPVRLSPATIERGVKDLKELLDRFEMCRLEDRWFESVGFWHKFGFLEV